MDITLKMVLHILSTSISLKPNASDADILTELKKVHPELIKYNIIDHLGSDLIYVLEKLVKGGYVKIHEGTPAKYNITLDGTDLNNAYTQMATSAVGLFNDREIIITAEWYIDTQGKSNITWLVYTHLKILWDNNNRADNIASQMEQTDRFTIYFLPDDPKHILVKRNPNFVLNENIKATNTSVQELNIFLKKTNKWMVVIVAITGSFIAGQFLLLLALSPKDPSKQLEQITQSQDSMKESLQGLDSSISKIVKDSLHAPSPPHK